MSGESQETLTREGVATIDLGLADTNPTISLSGKTIIDASRSTKLPRKSLSPEEREQSEKYRRVYAAIRRTTETCLAYDEPKEKMQELVGLTFIESMHDLGYRQTVTGQVKGSIPDHWKPENNAHFDPRFPKKNHSTFVYPTQEWESVKQRLYQFRDQGTKTNIKKP